MHRKIAKLPKPLRDLINSMLDDAAPAREIIAKLQESADPPLPYPISEQNISDWKNGGYQDYLRQQDWRADSRFLLESGSGKPSSSSPSSKSSALSKPARSRPIPPTTSAFSML